METSSFAAAVKNASELFFGHNPKYPLWILLALYLRKEGKLHIKENYIPDDSIDNLIWDWEKGADLGYASITFSDDTLEKWERDGIKNICIVGDIAGDEKLAFVVSVLKQETVSDHRGSALFAPQWEPSFLLEVARILLDTDDSEIETLSGCLRLGEIFDELLIRIFATSRFKGEFMQPTGLSRLVTTIVHKLGNTWKVYNPCCGVGTYIISDAPFVDYVGEEKSEVIYSIALLRTLCYGYDYCTQLVLGDSMRSKINDFSVMVSTPPFESFRNREANLLTTLITKCLDLDKPGVFVVPAGFCFSSSYGNLRERLIASDSLQGVIMLPSGIFAPYTGIQTAIIVIDPRIDHKSENIRFLDATSFIDEKSNELREEQIAEAWDGDSDFKVSVQKYDVIKRDYNFTPAIYLELNIEVPDGARLMSLEEVGTFIKEYVKNPEEIVRWATLASFNNANLLKTYPTVEIAPGKAMPNSLVINKDCVLISAAGGRGISLHIDENGPIYTHRNNVALIPNTDIILPQYLILELTKPYVSRRIKSMRASSFMKDAGQLKIVVPSIEVQKEVISQYQTTLLSRMGVEMSLIKTRREEESRRELESRKHRIGQILGNAVPTFDSLYAFVENATQPFDRDTEVDALFHSTLYEEMTSIKRDLKKATELLKVLTQEVDYSKEEEIDFCDFVAINAKELAPNKTNVFWFGELKENERPVILFSEQDLKVIFENIFTNAKKYGFTDENRKDYFILVNFRCVDIDNQSFLRILVSNNGSPLPPGMNPERVFEWGKGNGHGIGGWQIRNIVEHFGGRVTLEELPQNPEGHTLRYVILIPLIESTYEWSA
ncbi:MAG: N-6 DNA methylase [Bacteroides sp.]|nr:N-6 DNA methylase [Bacteroides sp.]